MTKKMTIVVALAMCAFAAFARPHGGFGGPRGGFHGGHRPAPVMHHGGYHHHSHSVWGRGGRNFWPAAVGGFVGGVVANAVVSPSTVVVSSPVVSAPVVSAPIVAAPVYTTHQVQANGTIVRVWVPGHYETRQVLVQ